MLEMIEKNRITEGLTIIVGETGMKTRKYESKFGSIRTVEINGTPWFAGADVAVILGYRNPKKAIRDHVDPSNVRFVKCDTAGGTQDLKFINEQGIHQLLYRCKFDVADQVLQWVDGVIIPDVCKGKDAATERAEELENQQEPYTADKKETIMNDLQIFENAQFGSIRVAKIDGEPWFVAADVCRALEISNSRDAVGRLDDDEKGVASTDTLGGVQEMSVVSEPGLYSLVLGSRKPEAKAFKRWITHDVIPAIRKHGLYAIDDIIANPDLGIAALRALKEEREKTRVLQEQTAVQAQQLAELRPKASYYDVVLACPDLLSTSEIAKDYGWSAAKLNKWLADQGIQYKNGRIWLLRQRYAERAYTSTKTHVYPGDDGTPHSAVWTYWTQKGRLFIYERMKANGILPIVERES